MIKQIYSVYDKKMGVYMDPMVSDHLVPLQRNLTEVAANPKSNLYKYPTDYELYCLGTVDQKTGEIECYPKPQFVLSIMELKQDAHMDPALDHSQEENNG